MLDATPLTTPPRAHGQVRLTVDDGRVMGLRQQGSLKLVFPRARDLQAVLVNTAGGVTGGDRFATELNAGSDLTVTTQTAERAYRSASGAGHLDTRITVAPGARMRWLPQETILFDGCWLDRRLRVDLAPEARLLLAEPLVFGRHAMGETLTRAQITDRITLCRDGQMIWTDRTALGPDMAAQLARPWVAGGLGAMALVLLADPAAEAALPAARALLPDSGGASLIAPDLLVVRVLAVDGFALRQTLIPVLERLSGDPLPRPWMI